VTAPNRVVCRLPLEEITAVQKTARQDYSSTVAQMDVNYSSFQTKQYQFKHGSTRYQSHQVKSRAKKAAWQAAMAGCRQVTFARHSEAQTELSWSRAPTVLLQLCNRLVCHVSLLDQMLVFRYILVL